MRDQVLSLWENGFDQIRSLWIDAELRDEETVPLLENLLEMDQAVQQQRSYSAKASYRQPHLQEGGQWAGSHQSCNLLDGLSKGLLLYQRGTCIVCAQY
jgi:hypothetical protein